MYRVFPYPNLNKFETKVSRNLICARVNDSLLGYTWKVSIFFIGFIISYFITYFMLHNREYCLLDCF